VGPERLAIQKQMIEPVFGHTRPRVLAEEALVELEDRIPKGPRHDPLPLDQAQTDAHQAYQWRAYSGVGWSALAAMNERISG
jgi:hypothetical protein